MTNENGESNRFDRIHGQLEGLGRVAGPGTVMQSMPIIGNVTTFTVETLRHDDDAICFVQSGDSDGLVRLVLPDKVVSMIIRQRERLFDRRTPASRKRQITRRELQRKRATDHDRGRHEKRPLQSCPDCS